MGTLFISLLTLVLLVISAFVILIVLMQRTSQSGGMGAALGGGAAESAFGSETNAVLTKGTIYGIIAFFLISLVLYLMYQAQAADRVQEVDISTLITSDEDAGTSEPIVVSADDAVAAPESAMIETTIPVVEEEASAVEQAPEE